MSDELGWKVRGKEAGGTAGRETQGRLMEDHVEPGSPWG